MMNWLQPRHVAGEVLWSEVVVEGAVAQHMVDGREDRCSHRDGGLLRPPARLEAQEVGQ